MGLQTWAGFVAAVSIGLAVCGGTQAQAGRMFGGKTSPPPPDWCFCARVCAGFTNTAPAGLVPQGQSLAICPQLHEEVIYDNNASCACQSGGPTQPLPGRSLSPNH